jgi:hypothetical protein
VDKCTIAQGFCRKTFDHKPVFLNFKKRKGKGRTAVSNSTVSHKFATDIVRAAAYLTLLSVCIPIAGLLSRTILEDEMVKVNQISTQINEIVFLEGTGQARELTEEETARLTRLEAEVVESWLRVAPLEYLYTFERQVPDDIYFEMLIKHEKKPS